MSHAGRVLIAGPQHAWLQQQVESHYPSLRLWEAADRDAFLREHGPSVRAVVTSGAFGADRALIDALPALEMIASFGVGYDKVDVDAARARGIRLSNTPDVLNDCVADLAVGLMIDASRRLSAMDRFVRAGKWAGKQAVPLAAKVSGKRVGIVGLGRIGQAIARRLEGFDATIAYTTRRPRPDAPYRYEPDLVALAEASDFLVVIVPGGPETRHLIDARVLRALGPQGILINVARGSVVDEAALVAALQDGTLGGAGLDVFEREPSVPDALLSMDNVVLLPHVGSATRETRQAMAALVFENLQAFFDGKPLPTAVC